MFRFTHDGPAGRIVADQQRETVERDGESLSLQKRQRLLLELLMASPHQVISLAKIEERVGSGPEVTRNNVSHLRRVLLDQKRALIETMDGGYRFSGDVVAVALADERPPSQTLAPGQHLPSAAGYLVERLSSNAGVERWLVSKQIGAAACREVRVAVHSSGRERLEREAMIHATIHSRFGEDLAVPISSNFLVPEYQILSVDGAWLSLARRAQTTASLLWQMSLSERVSFVAAVAEQVARLHDVGVIHGDLKAASVYVAEDLSMIRLGGLAHALIVSEEPKVEGSPQLPAMQRADWQHRRADSELYRAPELVADGMISEAGDVYALSVLLFQMVVGDFTRTLDAHWPSEVGDRVLRELIGEAAVRDPAERPAAAAFAARLRAYDRLLHESEEREAALAEAGALKAARERDRVRRPWQMGFVGLLVIAVAGLSFLSLQLESARKVAENRALEAAANLDFLQKVLRGADPRIPGVGPDESVRDAVDRAASQLDATYAELPDQHIAVLITLGDVQRGLRDTAAQEASFRKALALLEQTNPEDVHLRARLHFYLARIILLNEPGTEETVADKLERAEAELKRGRALLNSGRDIPLKVLLSEKVAAGNLSSQRGDFAAAEAELQDVVGIVRQDESLLSAEAYGSIIYFAQALLRRGKAEDAFGTLQWVSSVARERGLPDYVTIAGSTLTVQTGWALRKEGMEGLYEDTLIRTQQLFGKDTISSGQLFAYRGDYLNNVGRYDEALDALERAQTIMCESKIGPLYCKGIGASIATALIGLARYDEAELYLNDAEAVFESGYPAALPGIRFARAIVAFKAGDAQSARSLLERVEVRDLAQTSPGFSWSEYHAVLLAAIEAHQQPSHQTAQALRAAREAFITAGGPEAALHWAKI
jgi:DNA-binding winged helix-turn-helix (wHTH) protein/tetratricopeptide (TPR) repeat protein